MYYGVYSGRRIVNHKISTQAVRLVINTTVIYNETILNMLYMKLIELGCSEKDIKRFLRISSMASIHTAFTGRYTVNNKNNKIDLYKIIITLGKEFVLKIYNFSCIPITQQFRQNLILHLRHFLYIDPIYRYFTIDLELVFNSVDRLNMNYKYPALGQKYLAERLGVSAYIMLSNNVVFNNDIESSNKHEKYYVFDIFSIIIQPILNLK